jgi:hypothetical protein
VHLIEIYRSLYLFLADVYHFREDTLCLEPSLHLPLATEKFPCTSVNVARNIMWSLVNVLCSGQYLEYRDHISPLKATLAYRLFEIVHHTIHFLQAIKNNVHVYTGINNTRVYTVSTTLYTCIQGINYTRVYRVPLTLYTCIHGINNTMHAYTW